jgi:hypothetical protein
LGIRFLVVNRKWTGVEKEEKDLYTIEDEEGAKKAGK